MFCDGVPSENVEVNIEDGVITIKAEKKTEENLPAGRQGKKENTGLLHTITTTLVPFREELGIKQKLKLITVSWR